MQRKHTEALPHDLKKIHHGKKIKTDLDSREYDIYFLVFFSFGQVGLDSPAKFQHQQLCIEKKQRISR